MRTSLIQFNRSSLFESKADGGEKAAHGGLGLLRLCFGKTVKVTANNLKSSFKALDRCLLIRIAAVGLAVLILPVTLLLTTIGFIGLACSKSHPRLVDKYLSQLITNESSTQLITEQPLALPIIVTPPETPIPQPKTSVSPSTFTKKFGRAESIDFSSVWAKPQVYAVLEHLQKDERLAKLLNVWHLRENQKPGKEKLTMVDAISLELAKGTCFGQAMTILELLSSNSAEAISDHFIITNMSWKKHVYFQILHTLDIFLRNQGDVAWVNGVNVKDFKQHVSSLFPNHNRKGYSTPHWKLEKFDKEVLLGEFSDFIKQHVRGNNPTSDKHDYAVKITLIGENSGHAGIIHYSETQQRYFWYDPYRADYGLFSSEDHQIFFKGLVDKLLDYKTEKIFTKIGFTAYKI